MISKSGGLGLVGPMRLFIAVDLPDSVKTHCAALAASLPKASMSRPRDFHITLKFLGSCRPDRRAKIELALAQVAFKPFSARLAGLGTFGGSRPRVVWVGVGAPAELSTLAGEIEKRMEKLGFPKERRFAAHITLGRVREVEDPQRFTEALKKISAAPLTFPVSEFHLFESRLSPAGAEYAKLATFSGRP